MACGWQRRRDVGGKALDAEQGNEGLSVSKLEGVVRSPGGTWSVRPPSDRGSFGVGFWRGSAKGGGKKKRIM